MIETYPRLTFQNVLMLFLLGVSNSLAWSQETPPSPIQFVEGHESPIRATGYTPDGKIFFSADATGILKMWDRVTGELLSSGKWHDGAILTLAVSPTGQQIVTAGTGSKIVMSDVAIPRPLLDLTGVPGVPTTVDMTHDGTILLTGDESNYVSLWDPVAGKLVRNYGGATAPLVGVGWFEPTRSVIGASNDGTLREWNIDNAQLGGVLYTHPSTGMSVSRAGEQILLGGQDGAIRMVHWPPKAPQNLSGHGDIVPAVALSRDHKLIITGGYDQVVQLSQLSDGQPVRTLSGQVGRVFSVALSHDGEWGTAGSEQGTIQFWKTADGTIGPLLAGHAGAVNSLDFHPEQPQLLSAGLDGTIRLWAIPRPITPVPGHSQAVTAVAVNSIGDLLATGSLDKTVRISSVADGQPKQAINDFPQPIQSLSISADNTSLGVGDLNGEIWIRSINNGALISTWGGHVGGVTSILFPKEENRLISSGGDGTTKIWKLPFTAPVRVKAHEQAVNALAMTSDGKKLISGGQDEWIRVYNPENQQQVGSWKSTIGPITSVALSPDEKLLYIGSTTGKWQCWSFPDAVEKEQQMGHEGGIHALAVHPQGGELATVGADGAVKLWKPNEMPRVLSGHSGAVLSVTYTPDGANVISGGADATLRRWTVADGAQAQAYSGHQGQVTGVFVNADMSTIISTSLDKTVRAWTLASGEAKILTQPSAILSAAYTSEKNRIATCGEDLIVRIWDIATGRELQRFPASTAAQKSIRMLPTATGFISGGTDGQLTFGSINAETIILADEVKVHDLALVPDGTGIVTCGEDKLAKLWNMKGDLVRSFTGSGTALRFAAVRSDGMQVASGGDPLFSQPNVFIWNTADGAAVRTIAAPAAVMGIAATSDGHWLVSCADKKLRVYSGLDGVLMEEINVPAVMGETAMAPDLPLIVAAGADNNAYLLQRSLRRTFVGHAGNVTSVRWAPDGRRFLSAGIDQTIKLWDLDFEKDIATYAGINSPVNGLAVAGDGTRMGATTDDKRLLIWDLPAKDAAAPVMPTPPAVTITGTPNLRGPSTNRDGSLWCTSADDGVVYLWEGKTGKLKEKLIGHAAAVLSTAISSDGDTIVSGSSDRTVKRWVPAVQSLVVSGEQPIVHVRFSPEGKSFFTSDNSVLIQRWSVETMQPDKQWNASAPVRAMHVSVDGQYLAAATENQKVHIWNVEDGTETTWDSPVPVTAIAIASGGRKLIVSGNDHILRVCGLSNVEGQPTWSVTQTAAGHTDLIIGLTLPEDDRQLFSVSRDRTLKRWLAASSVPRLEFNNTRGIVYGAEFNLDGTLLATTGSDRFVRLWDVAKGEILATSEEHAAAVKSVTFNRQAKQLASADLSGTVRIWDWEAQQTQTITDPEMLGFNSVTISPNGAVVTAAGLGRAWYSWNREDGMLVRSGIGHSQTIVQLSASLAGNRMATLDESGHLSLWDSNNGQLRFHLQLPITTGYTAAYSPDNTEVLIGGNDNRLIRLMIPQNVQ